MCKSVCRRWRGRLLQWWHVCLPRSPLSREVWEVHLVAFFLPFSRRTKDCDATGERTHEKEKNTMERRMGENGLPLPLLPLFFGES